MQKRLTYDKACNDSQEEIEKYVEGWKERYGVEKAEGEAWVKLMKNCMPTSTSTLKFCNDLLRVSKEM